MKVFIDIYPDTGHRDKRSHHHGKLESKGLQLMPTGKLPKPRRSKVELLAEMRRRLDQAPKVRPRRLAQWHIDALHAARDQYKATPEGKANARATLARVRMPGKLRNERGRYISAASDCPCRKGVV